MELCGAIELFYPKPEHSDRQPVGAERMLQPSLSRMDMTRKYSRIFSIVRRAVYGVIQSCGKEQLLHAIWKLREG